MDKAWVDIILKVVVEVVDFIAKKIKEEDDKNGGKGGSKKK
jgi:hypothetical protein